jgi:hypothetical protein
MEISCATNGILADSGEILTHSPKRKINIGRPQLRRKDRHTLQEDGAGHAWPNPWWWWRWRWRRWRRWLKAVCNFRNFLSLHPERGGYVRALLGSSNKAGLITRLLSLSGSRSTRRRNTQTSDEKIEQTFGCQVKRQGIGSIFTDNREKMSADGAVR